MKEKVATNLKAALIGMTGMASAEAFADCTDDCSAIMGIVYTGEMWTNADGGIQQDSRYLDNLDLTLEVDTEKAFNLAGGTLFAYGLYNNKATFSDEVVGDAQVVSNIDTPHAFRLYEFWYDQTFMDSNASVRIGLYDLNSEFDANETGSLFINSSHGIGSDIAQTGENGPSIFPVTSLAARAHYQFSSSWYARAAILDAVPGDPDHPKRTAIKLGNGEGALLVAETGYISNNGSRVSVGGWHYTSKFDRFVPADDGRTRDRSQGIYLLTEKRMYSEPDHDTHGISAFLRGGVASSDVNTFKNYLGAGAVYTGAFDDHTDDQLGIAVAMVTAGQPFRHAAIAAADPVKRREINFEMTYRRPINDWLTIQPNIQYIVNPGLNPDLDNAFAIGLRFEVGHSLGF